MNSVLRNNAAASYSCAMSNTVGRAVRESSGGVQSVDRAVSVLEILARRGEARVSDVAEDLGVHKSTAFRLLGALEDRGLVEQTQARGKYRLGFGILRLAGSIPDRLDVTQQGRQPCEQLAEAVGETVNIAALQSHYAVNIHQARGSYAVSTHNWVGQLTPLHATSSGKILLAAMDKPRRDAVLAESGLPRFTRNTITTRRRLDTELAESLRSGYAVTVEEYEVGLNAVAAPIRSFGGVVVAAVSLSGPAYRFTEARMEQVLDSLRSAAGEISARMGYLE